MKPIRSPGNSRPRRSDLTLRKLNEEIGTDDEPANYLDDKRLDDITDRVIEHMHKTDVNDWEPVHWSLFQKIWIDRRLRKTKQGSVQSLTLEELKNLATSSVD